jgi:hypothetical protein
VGDGLTLDQVRVTATSALPCHGKGGGKVGVPGAGACCGARGAFGEALCGALQLEQGVQFGERLDLLRRDVGILQRWEGAVGEGSSSGAHGLLGQVIDLGLCQRNIEVDPGHGWEHSGTLAARQQALSAM